MFSRKRHLVLNSTWFFLMLAMWYIILLAPVLILNSTYHYIIAGVLFATTLAIQYLAMQGSKILGIDSDDFQKTVIDIIKRRGLQFEQSVSNITITDPFLIMHIATNPAMGTAHVKNKSKTNHDLYDSLLSEIKTTGIKYNSTTPLFYIILGVLLLTLGVALYY